METASAARKALSVFTALLTFSLPAFSQVQADLTQITTEKNYILVERTDLRRYDNGKYTGLTSREIRSFISPSRVSADQTLYDGNFYVWQETRRNMRQVSTGLNDAIPSIFTVDSSGCMEMVQDNGYPSFRNFPAMDTTGPKIGDSWTAEAQRSVDPDNRGHYTVMPMLVQYQYIKDDVYRDQDVMVFSAKWATRYGGKVIDPDGDPLLKSAAGTHRASIIVSRETGMSLVIRDTLEENFCYVDGKQITYKGAISLFTEYPPVYDSTEVYQDLQKFAQETTGAVVERTSSGLRLTMRDLQFMPDSAELVPGQEESLEAICEIVAKAKDQMLLIEGHTARIGQTGNEMQLSLDRAHTIASELISRGISREKIICRGSGGTRPIADNSTPEGRALNRRVEITILE